MEYIAYLHKDRKSDYGVSFPDFPGCTTAGRTLDEASGMAAEALALHIQGMVEDGEEVPEPSRVDDIAADAAKHHAIAFMVSVDAPDTTVRVNITARESQIARIDALAEAAGLTRSGYMVRAAIGAAGGEKKQAGRKFNHRQKEDHIVKQSSGWDFNCSAENEAALKPLSEVEKRFQFPVRRLGRYFARTEDPSLEGPSLGLGKYYRGFHIPFSPRKVLPLYLLECFFHPLEKFMHHRLDEMPSIEERKAFDNLIFIGSSTCLNPTGFVTNLCA